jgi:hypothetical protein
MFSTSMTCLFHSKSFSLSRVICRSHPVFCSEVRFLLLRELIVAGIHGALEKYGVTYFNVVALPPQIARIWVGGNQIWGQGGFGVGERSNADFLMRVGRPAKILEDQVTNGFSWMIQT